MEPTEEPQLDTDPPLCSYCRKPVRWAITRHRDVVEYCWCCDECMCCERCGLKITEKQEKTDGKT